MAGAAFSGTAGSLSGSAGSLVYRQVGASTLIMGDINDDRAADSVIALQGNHTLYARDFAL